MNVTRIARTYALAERPGTEGEAMSAYCTLLRSVGDEGNIGVIRQSSTPTKNIAEIERYVQKCMSEVAHTGDRAKYRSDQDMARQGAYAVLAARLAQLGPGAIRSIQQVAGPDIQPMLKIANGIWACATTTLFNEAPKEERLDKWIKANRSQFQSVLLSVSDHVVPYGFAHDTQHKQAPDVESIYRDLYEDFAHGTSSRHTQQEPPKSSRAGSTTGRKNAQMTVEFKAKVKNMRTSDGIYQYVQVPTLTRAHCNMDVFRNSKRFGNFANSDFFNTMLDGHVRQMLDVNRTEGRLRLDRLPANVTADTSKFLAVITITIPEIP
jgi:hypothetical protein